MVWEKRQLTTSHKEQKGNINVGVCSLNHWVSLCKAEESSAVLKVLIVKKGAVAQYGVSRKEAHFPNMT